MKRSLVLRVAELVDSTSFACTPEMYGLRTRKEFMEKTMAGAGQRLAMKRARQIIRMVREESQ